MPDNFMEIKRAQMVLLAARNNVPTVSQTPVIARDGGLLSGKRGEKDVFLRRYRCSGGGFWQGDITKPPLLGFALLSDCFTGCATL